MIRLYRQKLALEEIVWGDWAITQSPYIFLINWVSPNDSTTEQRRGFDVACPTAGVNGLLNVLEGLGLLKDQSDHDYQK
jgi:hypothetical protein